MEEFKAYTMKTSFDKFLIAGAGVLFTAGGIYMLLKTEYLIGAVALVFGLAALYGGLFAGRSDAAVLKKLEQEGLLDEVVADFTAARSFADDQVRFGEKYIFQRKLVKPIAYEDIVSVKYGNSYEHSGESDRLVYHVSIGYKEIPLHPLYSLEYDHPLEAEKMIDIIKGRNPNVTVKY